MARDKLEETLNEIEKYIRNDDLRLVVRETP